MSFNDLEQGLGSSSSSPISDDQEYKQLTQRIAQQIFYINGNITSIERLISLLGGSKDTTEIRDKLHDITDATRDLIKTSTQDLKTLSSLASLDPKTSRHRRLEQQKLSKDFQKVLSSFQNIQKISISKQRESVDKTKAITVMLQTQANDDNDTQQDSQNTIMNQQRQAQLDALDNEIEYNELLINEREIEIQNIEQGITELNEIFRDMNMIVNEQESGIQSIYGNILNIAQNTKQAADELVVASRHQRSARRTMCCFLMIITIVGCLLAIIILFAK